jgi:hypothetical protein
VKDQLPDYHYHHLIDQNPVVLLKTYLNIFQEFSEAVFGLAMQYPEIF